jgi:FixJ family two-component response regulator
MGFSAEAFASGADFLQSRSIVRTACLIADVNMPGMSGFDLHGHLSAQGHAVPTVLITAYPAESARSLALESGIVAYLAKPFVEADLLEAVNVALARRR